MQRKVSERGQSRAHKLIKQFRKQHILEYGEPPTDGAIAAELNRLEGEQWTARGVKLLRKRAREENAFSMPTLLDGAEKKADDAKIKRFCDARDRDGLVELFIGELGGWVQDILRSRNLVGRGAELKEELVSEGVLELFAAVGRNLEEKKSAAHLRNSLRIAVQGKLRIHLDELPAVSAKSATLKDRRLRERRGGDRKRPDADRRPADMPERVEAKWSGHYSFELSTQNDLGTTEEKWLALDSDRLWRRVQYIGLVEQVHERALELAESKVLLAVRWILDAAPRMKATQKCRERIVKAAAREADLTPRELKSGLDALGHRIAATLSPLALDFAADYLKTNWPKIIEYAENLPAESDWVAIGISSRQAA